MDSMRLSENIIKLRHKRGVTQDELATFIGVTKASVSKWETKQSCPDIMLLPQLASFFDVTIDNLLGYEPQMSQEQIKKCYHDLAADFASQPFDEVMKKSEALVKKYYSCYAFLLQICVLWINHFMLAKEQTRQVEILNAISDLCQHITAVCKEIGVCNDALTLKAVVDLQMGRAQEVIDSMEEILNPKRFAKQSDTILIQAYRIAGDTKKADQFAQISMFTHLMDLISSAVLYLTIHVQEPALCEKTIARVDRMIGEFRLESLNPNTAAIFNYQAAAVYCLQQNNEEALERLQKFVFLTRSLITSGMTLHGDGYFNLLDDWFSELDLGVDAVRDKKVVLAGAVEALNLPAFAPLAQNEKFIQIKKSLLEQGENS